MATAEPVKEQGLEQQESVHEDKRDELLLPSRGSWRWPVLVVALLSSIFLHGLDNTIVADIQPDIVKRFDSVNELPWLSVGFPLGGVALMMLVGKLYTSLDAKWLFITFLALFMIGSAICGAAPTMSAEIVGRVIAGVGGNGMYLGINVLLSRSTSDVERPMYLNLVGGIFGIALVVGPLVGGGFAAWNWRFAFYLNLFVGAICAPIYFIFIAPADPMKGTRAVDRARVVDWIGAALAAGGYLTLVMLINFGGQLYSWSSGSMIVLYVLAPIFWISFALQQSFAWGTTRERRIFPIQLLSEKEPILLALSMATNICGGFVPVYYIPLFFQFTRGDSAIQASVRLLPLLCCFIFTMILSGGLLPKFQYYKVYFVIGSGLGLIANALLSTATIHTSTARMYGYSALSGIGGGLYGQLPMSVIQGSAVSKVHSAVGVTFVGIWQISGITVGLSVAGAVFINTGKNHIQRLLNIPSSEVSQLLAGTSTSLLQQVDPNTRTQILEAIVAAIDKVFIVCYTSFALGFVAACLMKWQKTYADEPAPSTSEVTSDIEKQCSTTEDLKEGSKGNGLEEAPVGVSGAVSSPW